jgi:hypothetical protein
MSNIRQFRNADLPALADVWDAHWSRSGPPPQVNVPIIEQAVLSRTFFDASTLLVALQDGTVQAWCHYFQHPIQDQLAVVCALCFNNIGSQLAEELLGAAEDRIAQLGCSRIVVGSVRDHLFGYSGLAPIGPGIGIPVDDQATTSLLGSLGYTALSSIERMVVGTDQYRMPVSRDALQFRRSTQVDRHHVVAPDPRQASALSHFDIEGYTLIDKRSASELANIQFWFSDPEAHVMRGNNAIVDLSVIGTEAELSPAQKYLLAAVLQTISGRRVSTVEAAVESEHVGLIEQLSKLQFRSQQQGARWQKLLSQA